MSVISICRRHVASHSLASLIGVTSYAATPTLQLVKVESAEGPVGAVVDIGRRPALLMNGGQIFFPPLTRFSTAQETLIGPLFRTFGTKICAGIDKFLVSNMYDTAQLYQRIDGIFALQATLTDRNLGASSMFGRSCAFQDYNGDGQEDLVVASPGEPEEGCAFRSGVHGFYGPIGDAPVEAAAFTLTGQSGCPGYAMAGEDFTADGQSDLLVSAVSNRLVIVPGPIPPGQSDLASLPGRVALGPANHYTGIRVVDANFDGHADIVSEAGDQVAIRNGPFLAGTDRSTADSMIQSCSARAFLQIDMIPYVICIRVESVSGITAEIRRLTDGIGAGSITLATSAYAAVSSSLMPIAADHFQLPLTLILPGNRFETYVLNIAPAR